MTEATAGDDPGQPPVPEALVARARTERWAERLFERDTSLWSSDPEVQATIAQRLGWLDAPTHFHGEIGPLEAFGEAMRDAGFTTAIVGGMGGSSLAPEVLQKTFGSGEDWLELRVLDSTDPAAVGAVVDDRYPLETLFVVATKSGTTAEPLAFQADAWARIEAAIQERHLHKMSPGDFMVAITDPDRSLDAIPHHDAFREVFLNPPDIGGRYAALSYVGLVPASLIGLDLDPFLASARSMLDRCHAKHPEANPGVSLGLFLGSNALAGRDKLTFVADPEIASFGSWAEQLIAESTGKHGVGIVPVDLEPLGGVDAYGPDRVFVRLTVADSAGPAPAADGTAAADLLTALEAVGHPVVRIALADPIDLAGEFVRWEVATAIAGIVLGIDPFDQPNVEEAKEGTRHALAAIDGAGRADGPPGDAPVRADDPGLAATLRTQLDRLASNGYVCLQAYVAPSAERDAALSRIRAIARDRTRRATTAGYGPRFLHSTGQLHKGGPPIGWFLQLTADHPVDRPIPGKPYTFGQLIDAQAAGDLAVLRAHDLPVLRIHLGSDPDAGLAALERALAAALKES
ncbi:MAG TPA: glucose-6-phosphate isomerase [Patescibacteria group bacterium]|nr:glucose-6-phosphate isomerase [Patescibacteria group bacterium]